MDYDTRLSVENFINIYISHSCILLYTGIIPSILIGNSFYPAPQTGLYFNPFTLSRQIKPLRCRLLFVAGQIQPRL